MTGEFRVPVAGDLINGRYRIEAEIGRGGFGIVYRATQVGMERIVALKVLLPHAMIHEDMVERFRREAMLARNLNHPNTIRLYDFGQTEGNVLFIAMEFLEGRTLDHIIKQDGPLEPERVHRVGVQILKSLAEAHQNEIIHRDLKPANIMVMQNIVGEEDFVKVLDFGIAKAFGEEGDTGALTKTGIGFGTPFYMAPEQVRGKGIRPGTDLYALGLVMAEALSGKVVCTGESSMDVAVKQLSADPPPIPDWVLRGPLGPVIQRATQKDIQQRYPSASEMLRDLRQIDTAASIDVSTRIKTSELPKLENRSKLPLVLFAVSVVLLLFAAAIVGGLFYFSVDLGLSGDAKNPGLVEADAGGESDRDEALVSITVSSQPEGASVYRADEYLGSTPMVLEFEPGKGKSVALKLRLDGFNDETLEVETLRDRRYQVEFTIAESPPMDAPDAGAAPGAVGALPDTGGTNEPADVGVAAAEGTVGEKAADRKKPVKGAGKGKGAHKGKPPGNRGKPPAGGNAADKGKPSDKGKASGKGKAGNKGGRGSDTVHVPRL